MLNWLKRKTEDLLNHRHGSVAILAGVALPIAIISIGTSVDFLRLQDTKVTAQRAIDSATLSAAIDLAHGRITIEELEAHAEEIFRLNLTTLGSSSSALENGPLDEDDSDDLAEGDDDDAGAVAANADETLDFDGIAVDGFSISINEQLGIVVANTTIQVPTLLSSLIGIDSLSADVGASADFSSTALEIAFVLDTTGSMRGSRLAALKEAMTDSLQLLLPDTRFNNQSIRVSIVPYATSVNLGEFHVAAVGAGTASAQSLNSCVTEREGLNAFTDVAPTVGQSNTYYETDRLLRNFVSNACPRAAVVPLTDNRQELQDLVNNLEANGFTAGHMGIDWGINTISGAYRDFWPAASQPAEYGTPDTRKILVVMTDGEFNTAFYNTGRLRNVSQVLGRRRQDAETATDKFCDLAKEEERGIEIYTIAFLAGSRAENLLSECASEDTNEFPGPHFHSVGPGEDLGNVFESIVRQILQVRLTG